MITPTVQKLKNTFLCLKLEQGEIWVLLRFKARHRKVWKLKEPLKPQITKLRSIDRSSKDMRGTKRARRN